MRRLFLLLAIAMSLLVVTACSDDGRPPSSRQTSDQTLHQQQQTAAIETGIAFGTALSRMALPPALRERSFSGIDYDSTDVSKLLTILGVPADDAKAIASTRKSVLTPETDMKVGANELLNPLSQKIRPLLEARGDQLLDKTIRIGFAIGTGCESASIILSTKPDDSQAPRTTKMIREYWTRFNEDVAIANLPTAITARLQQINPEFTTVSDIRAFRDKCFEFWNMIHTPRVPDDAPTGAGWTEYRHPLGFTFYYPPGWTTLDTQRHSVMLLPPGAKLGTPNTILVIVNAMRGVSNPLTLKSHYEQQLEGAKILNYSEGAFNVKDGAERGTILTWDIEIPQTQRRGGFAAYVFVSNGWAIQLAVIGPTEIARASDSVLRRIAETVEWPQPNETTANPPGTP